jgi:phenylacetate-coenzyme A ligase PaaK-like adenylate-forming protein
MCRFKGGLFGAINIGDGEISPITFDDVMYTPPEVINYQAAITREGDKDKIVITVEVTDKEEIPQKIKEAIMSIPLVKRNIERGRMTDPEIEIVDSIKRKGRSKKVIPRF